MEDAELTKLSKELEKNMFKAATELNFELAAELRDRLAQVRQEIARRNTLELN